MKKLLSKILAIAILICAIPYAQVSAATNNKLVPNILMGKIKVEKQNVINYKKGETYFYDFSTKKAEFLTLKIDKVPRGEQHVVDVYDSSNKLYYGTSGAVKAYENAKTISYRIGFKAGKYKIKITPSKSDFSKINLVLTDKKKNYSMKDKLNLLTSQKKYTSLEGVTRNNKYIYYAALPSKVKKKVAVLYRKKPGDNNKPEKIKGPDKNGGFACLNHANDFDIASYNSKDVLLVAAGNGADDEAESLMAVQINGKEKASVTKYKLKYTKPGKTKPTTIMASGGVTILARNGNQCSFVVREGYNLYSGILTYKFEKGKVISGGDIQVNKIANINNPAFDYLMKSKDGNSVCVPRFDKMSGQGISHMGDDLYLVYSSKEDKNRSYVVRYKMGMQMGLPTTVTLDEIYAIKANSAFEAETLFFYNSKAYLAVNGKDCKDGYRSIEFK